LGLPCIFTGLAEAIVNVEVPRGDASFLASATHIPLDKLDSEQRRAQEKQLCDHKGTWRPIGIGSVLVRLANRALFAVIGDEVPQSSVARHQLGVGVHGEAKIVQFMVRAALDASPDWADMQGDASTAFNEFLRRPLFEELSSNPALRPLLRVATMLYGRTYIVYVYDSSNAYGTAMRIPSTCGVHQGCVLGAMFFAIVAFRVYKKLAAVAPNESTFCDYSVDGHFLGSPTYVVAIGEAKPAEYASVGLTVIILKNCLHSLVGVGDAFDKLPNGQIMRGIHVSSEEIGVRGGGC
jgi:hypothetical protein